MIREVDIVIDAYGQALDFMRNAMNAHGSQDLVTFTAEREKAYKGLSELLDGLNIQPMDLADSFRQVHLHTLRLIWSEEPQQWLTAIRMIQRLRQSCTDSRNKATADSQS